VAARCLTPIPAVLPTRSLNRLLRADLVFIQNGMLQPWLDSVGLGDNTQVILTPRQQLKGPRITALVAMQCTHPSISNPNVQNGSMHAVWRLHGPPHLRPLYGMQPRTMQTTPATCCSLLLDVAAYLQVSMRAA
jgi:hypothetical protein